MIEVELAANPSHLEAVDPVVVGMARAKQDQIDEPGSLPGAAGPASTATPRSPARASWPRRSTSAMIKGYRVGGTIHLIINNQLGFTTPPESARSSEYCTDVAKMVQAPIFHVNGDDPEACVRVARLAFDYRQRFNKDVVIDMVCYRRHGHNEGDDPSYTQPLMYKRIDARRSVRKLYTEALVKRGDISLEEAEQALDDFQAPPAGGARRDPPRRAAQGRHAPRRRRRRSACCPTSPPASTGRSSTASTTSCRRRPRASPSTRSWPSSSRPARRCSARRARSTGPSARRSPSARCCSRAPTSASPGQDSRRGTFSHRHAVLVDNETEADCAPLANLDPDQAKFWIYDSLLSRVRRPRLRVRLLGRQQATRSSCWEAQFGDFVNGAQIIIDQFLVAAEDKWGQTSGLVMLLPHGYEGQGPEHSLGPHRAVPDACAEDNIQVANATTAAQYFHLLRRQMHRDVRKPLIVFTPKSLLRAKSARSTVEELTTGSFQEVLDDPTFTGDPAAVHRVVLASGKVGHDAIAARDASGRARSPCCGSSSSTRGPTSAWPRRSSLYPNANEIVWLQEEPENMGPWNFVKGKLYEALGDRFTIKRVSRFESGSPATGSKAIHDQEQEAILDEALDG